MKKSCLSVGIFSGALLFTSSGFADAMRADGHAPIGVMGDHLHKKGEVMLSYRFMDMEMGENYSGTNNVSTADVLQDYLVAPLSMTMRMHMVGMMYAPSDDLTLMTMLPFIENEMDHRTRMGAEFTTASDGIGDAKISGLYRLYSGGKDTLILNLGISLPTGSISEKDYLPPINAQGQLPYPMQIGSGTYDLLPGLTYVNQQSDYSWGAQAMLTLRLGENDHDYSLGDRMSLTSWFAMPFAHHFSWSARIAYDWWDDIDELDSEAALPVFNPMMNSLTVPTVDPALRGGQRIDAGLGVNWVIPGAMTNRLALEVLLPAYRDLHGPQLDRDYSLMLGYQLAF